MNCTNFFALFLASTATAPPVLPKEATVTVLTAGNRLPVLTLPASLPNPVKPGTPVRLTKDLLYVFDWDTTVMVISSPPGFLKTSREDGPLKIKGRFVESPGEVKTRTFAGKSVWTVDLIPNVDPALVELIVVPVGSTDPNSVQRQMIDTGVGPRPPPTPDPNPPKPPPTPTDPSPFTEPGFRVLMVFDSNNTVRPAAQNSVLYGKAVRDYLELKCVVGPDGVTKEYRIYPANTVVDTASATWKAAFGKKGGDDWILIGDGKTGYSGPLPKTEAEAMELLRKHGGN